MEKGRGEVEMEGEGRETDRREEEDIEGQEMLMHIKIAQKFSKFSIMGCPLGATAPCHIFPLLILCLYLQTFKVIKLLKLALLKK